MSAPTYRSRAGQRLSPELWQHLMVSEDYRVVAVSCVGEWLVETWWLGWQFLPEAPLYSTQVWRRDAPDVVDEHGWGTETAALRGHRALVEALEARR